MIRKSLPFLTAAILALLLVAPASAVTRVFLLAGQSNMAGEGGYNGYMSQRSDKFWVTYSGSISSSTGNWTVYPRAFGPDAACPAAYSQPSSTVKFWNYVPDNRPADYPLSHNAGVGNGWIPLQNGYGQRTDEFGPELSFGARIQELYPNDEIYLVKYAVGGTDLGNNWNPSVANNCYTNFKARVNAAINNIRTVLKKDPVVSGMLWMQGENDSTVDSYAHAYAANLKNLITNVRNTTYNAQDMKFVAGRITYAAQQWSDKTHLDLVRNAQWNVGNTATSYGVANASCVNTDDLEWAFYEHYGTQGCIDLGLRFANEFPGSPTPEPSTLALAGAGLVCLIAYARRKRKQS